MEWCRFESEADGFGMINGRLQWMGWGDSGVGGNCQGLGWVGLTWCGWCCP